MTYLSKNKQKIWDSLNPKEQLQQEKKAYKSLLQLEKKYKNERAKSEIKNVFGTTKKR